MKSVKTGKCLKMAISTNFSVFSAIQFIKLKLYLLGFSATSLLAALFFHVFFLYHF